MYVSYVYRRKTRLGYFQNLSKIKKIIKTVFKAEKYSFWGEKETG